MIHALDVDSRPAAEGDLADLAPERAVQEGVAAPTLPVVASASRPDLPYVAGQEEAGCLPERANQARRAGGRGSGHWDDGQHRAARVVLGAIGSQKLRIHGDAILVKPAR